MCMDACTGQSGTGPVLGGGEGDSREVCPQGTVRSMLDGMAGMRHPTADNHACEPRAERVLCRPEGWIT